MTVVQADELGYRSPVACHAADVSFRCLDYWARTGLVEPSIRSANGSGTQRLYSSRDVLMLRIVKRLLDTGVSLQNIRVALAALDDYSTDDLAALTLLSDGATVWMLRTTSEVLDVLQSGTAVYGIGLARVVEEITARLEDLPGERTAGCEPEPPPAALQVVS